MVTLVPVWEGTKPTQVNVGKIELVVLVRTPLWQRATADPEYCSPDSFRETPQKEHISPSLIK